MSKLKMPVKLVKLTKTAKKALTKKAAVGAPPPASLQVTILDDQNVSVTVEGVDAAGFLMDISAIATLTPAPVSSDVAGTIFTVSAPTGMAVTVTGHTPGTGTLAFTATWNDGSIGPFTFTLPVTITTGGPTGITVVIGQPV